MGFVSPQPQFGYAPDQFDSSAAIYEDVSPRLSLVRVGSRMQSWQYLGVKRGIDIVFSAVMIIACLGRVS